MVTIYRVMMSTSKSVVARSMALLPPQYHNTSYKKHLTGTTPSIIYKFPLKPKKARSKDRHKRHDMAPTTILVLTQLSEQSSNPEKKTIFNVLATTILSF
ncbi:hypothetical protein ElyMa_003842300 [Elysia marginata]|uniref:Uncharacterized protein n=1 Tax=Elysia marginata TaxID=1093978 RepID=A0AAV4FGL2_9GAST|nr:hypothetical protein ElyMa_003842300 [Elysia marginata]